jgi:hypothetical protein
MAEGRRGGGGMAEGRKNEVRKRWRDGEADGEADGRRSGGAEGRRGGGAEGPTERGPYLPSTGSKRWLSRDAGGSDHRK